jgi:hypothetical protein
MTHSANWVNRTVVCSLAKWVNGTDLCPTSHWGIGSKDCPTAYWVMRTEFCSLSQWGFGNDNCSTAYWVKRTDLYPNGGMRLRSHAPVASLEARRKSDCQQASSRLNMIAAHENALACGPGRRDEACDVCERSTGPLGPSCEARKGFVHVW